MYLHGHVELTVISSIWRYFMLLRARFNPSETGVSQSVTLANSEDPDKMPHDAAIRQGLHCLLRQNRSSEKEIQFCFEIITCVPYIYYGTSWLYCT